MALVANARRKTHTCLTHVLTLFLLLVTGAGVQSRMGLCQSSRTGLNRLLFHQLSFVGTLCLDWIICATVTLYVYVT